MNTSLVCTSGVPFESTPFQNVSFTETACLCKNDIINKNGNYCKLLVSWGGINKTMEKVKTIATRHKPKRPPANTSCIHKKKMF